MKTKKIASHAAAYATIVALCIAGASATAFSGGPGKSPQARPSVSPRPLIRSPIAISEGGSDVGGGSVGSVDTTIAWCRGASGILSSYMKRSEVSQVLGDFQNAKAILKNGLIAALNDSIDQGAGQSLTFKVLSRALEIADAVDAEAQSQALYDNQCGRAEVAEARLRAADEMTVLFMVKSYSMLNAIAGTIDVEHFIPYTMGGMQPDMPRFEEAYIKYANLQLSWITSSEFVTENGIDQSYVPKTGMDRIYLRALGMIADGVKQDLQESIFKDGMGCAIQQLRIVSESLEAHLAGDVTQFGGKDKYAVNASYPQILEVQSRLTNHCKIK